MDFNSMLKGMQSKLQKAKDEKEKARFTAEAGGGLISVTIDGSSNIKEIKIDESLKGEEFVIIADLIVVAYSNARKDAEENDELSEDNLMKKMPFPFKPPF